jgi:hypothetical protein
MAPLLTATIGRALLGLLFLTCAAEGLELNPIKWANVQKITTAMLQNNVPKYSTILELTQVADARSVSLYNIPCKLIMCSAQLGDASLLKVAAEQTAVPLECRQWAGPAELADMADVDVVVSHRFMGSAESARDAIAVARAALRPGGRLVWIEADDKQAVSAFVQAEWKTAFPKAEIFTDAEDGLDLGVAVKPPEPPTNRYGQPRGSPQAKKKGFGA